MLEKVCIDCGCEYEAKTKRSRLCPTCYEEVLRNAKNRHKAKRPVEKPIKKEAPKKPSICDSYCRGCYYLLGGNSRLMSCDYFEKADKLRPCPAGKGCTVKITTAQYHAQQRRKHKEKPKTWIVKCGICGKEFVTNDKRRRNCSKECTMISRHRATMEQAKRLKEERNGKRISGTAEG